MIRIQIGNLTLGTINNINIIITLDQICNYFNNNSSIEIEEIKYCIENEGVNNLFDFYYRRSGLAYFNPKKIPSHINMTLTYMKNYFKWTDNKAILMKNELIKQIESSSCN